MASTDVQDQIAELNHPKQPPEPIPDAPEDLYENADYRFVFGPAQLPTKPGETKARWVDAFDHVLEHLPKYKAAGPAGCRYEHYAHLPHQLVLQYSLAAANDDQSMLSDDFRAVFRTGVCFAGDKQKKDRMGRQAARPIVCGLALRRVVGRVIATQMRVAWTTGLAMFRSVMGVPAGIEIGHNVVKGWISAMEQDVDQQDEQDVGDLPVAIQVDFENGYNSAKRSVMLENCKLLFPKVYRYVRLLYATDGQLVYLHN